MKGKGRTMDQALLRTTANKKAQTFATKRLMRDLEEIEKEKIPTVGVTARPLEHDLFLWHANIRGPDNTPYEGGVFHLELRIPQSYPHHPPEVTLFTTIPHPNIFGNHICLDILQVNKREEGQGWSSGYSIQSILMQLQSFLFEEDLNQEKNQFIQNVKKAVKEANNFKCLERNCKHGGKLSCFPAFSVRQSVPEQFCILDQENDIIDKELVCYHTKLHYKQNILGIGLKISKLPRTGAIREAQALYDYISIKAFLKESINWSSSNEQFTHWLPIYFGKQDNSERFYKFICKSLSMIITNNTKNFKPEFILQVFPKIMITLIYYIMDEKKHASVRIIRLLTHVHAMFLFLLTKYPELEKDILKTINNFIQKEDNRIKDVQPNLGCILALLSVTDKKKFSDIVEAYFSEQLDRQVLWILKAVPQLIKGNEKEQDQKELDQVRAKIVFKAQTTSFQILCFYKLFISDVCEARASRKELLEHYEGNLCKLTNSEQEKFQKKVFHILREIKDFNGFFNYVGLKERNASEINQLLKKAIKNSARKKYHGDFEEIHNLPTSEVQFKNLLSKYNNFRTYYDVTTKVGEQNKKDVEISIKIKKQSTQEDWKVMCAERWAWIREQLINDPHQSSDTISYKATIYFKEGIVKAEDRLFKIINQKYRKQYIRYNAPKIDLPKISWKHLFLRLDLEDFLLHIDMNPDFKQFYEKLELCKYEKLNTLLIPLIQINHLKSGYYYLCSTLGKLTTLKYLEFCGLSGVDNVLEEKAAKSIKKGLNNFKEGKGDLQFIGFSNFNGNRDLSDSLLGFFGDAEKIQTIRFENTNLLSLGNTAKIFSNYLSNLSELLELKLNKCQISMQQSKLLADSIMRLKKLRIVEIRGNGSMGLGLSSIIYNLSFNSNLHVLNISESTVNSGNDEMKELIISLEKLLKISGSVQVLDCSKILGMNQKLTKEFWAGLGECRSIRVFDISHSGTLDNSYANLGRTVAFNAKKKGQLQYINLSGCLNNPSQLVTIYDNMNISEYDEEVWYGDPNKVAKMISSNYPAKFYNNLKALQLDLCSSLNPPFSLANHNRLTNKVDPEYVKLFARSAQLETLSLASTNQQKAMTQILLLALDTRRPNYCSRIKVLNLSKNYLGKEGAKILSQILQINNVLEIIDLSKNNIGVSGAQVLAGALRKNKSVKFFNFFNNKISFDGAKAIAEYVLPYNNTLEFLELGHNRMRDKGLIALINGIAKNPESRLRTLGLRFNFLTKKGIDHLLLKISESKNNLEEIFIKNNLLDDIENFALSKYHKELKLNVSVDIFEKLKYLESQRSERTVWVHPVIGLNRQQIKNFFEITHRCGIVLDVRIRKGRKYPNRTKTENLFALVEFADTISVTHALHVASKKLSFINGIKFRIYKSGTGTFIFMKKTAKQRKIEDAKRLLPTLPFDAPIVATTIPGMGGMGGMGGMRPMRGMRGTRGRGRPQRGERRR